MWEDLGCLVFSLGLVLVGCELFTNSIEWLGYKLGLGDGIIGSVFSAIGTCLPETMIPIMSLIIAGAQGQSNTQAIETAKGAILGAPFMLGTLAFFVTGLALFVCEGTRKKSFRACVDKKAIARDLSYFVCTGLLVLIFSLLNRISLLPNPVKLILGACLLLIYIRYIIDIARHNATSEHFPEKLYLSRFIKKENLVVIIIQMVCAFGAIFKGAEVFVEKTMDLGQAVGLSVFFLSSIIMPIATELPEKLNSVIWISKGKDTLAIGNITGAMVFQSCIPVAIGVIFTDWVLSKMSFVTIIIPIITASYIYWRLIKKGEVKARHLMLCGLLYLLYLYLNFN